MAGPGATAGRSLTEGPIMRALLLFSLPTLGANVLQSMNGSINAIWIGRFLGETALAATANANIILFLMFSLGFGFGLATTILIGQSVGAGDIVGARRAMGTGLGIFALVSVLIALIGYATSGSLLRLLATPPEARDFALAYLRVIFLGLPPMFLVLLLTMGLRGIGDAITPLRFMILNVALDAGLNPVFILGLGPAPRLGIAGAATATLIANYVVLVVAIAYIYWADKPIRLRGRELRFLIPNPALLRIIGAKGFAMGLQMMVMTLSGLLMIGLINRLGVTVAAAYSVATQLWTYVQMPAMAIGAAVSAMAAQNIGAGLWDRVERITRSGLIINLALTGGIVALLLLFDRPVMGLFVGMESPIIPVARHIQFIASWSFILFGGTLVFFSVVRANGAVVAPLLILTAGILVGRFGFAWALMPLHPDMLWWSFPISSASTLAAAAAYYQFGNWRKQGMIGRTVKAEAAMDGVA